MSSEEYEIPRLSTGAPSTLGNWHALCVAMFGEDSPATAFIKWKLDQQGPDMPVIADEGQLLYSLLVMNLNGSPGQEDTPMS